MKYKRLRINQGMQNRGRSNNSQGRRPASRDNRPHSQGIEMGERPPSRLKSGIGREKKIVFQRPERRNRKLMDAPQKKILMAYENKPSRCVQLIDQIILRMKHLFRNSCCVLVASLVVLIFSAAFFATARHMIEPKTWPEFNLENLKHPLYQTAHYDATTDAFKGNTDNAAELESFMQFAGYTNIEKKNAEGEWVPSYDPATDLTGPGSYMPMQCFTGVPNKYKSPVIALIKQGTQLETDLYSQIQGVVANMQAVKAVMLQQMAALFAENSQNGAEGSRRMADEEDAGAGAATTSSSGVETGTNTATGTEAAATEATSTEATATEATATEATATEATATEATATEATATEATEAAATEASTTEATEAAATEASTTEAAEATSTEATEAAEATSTEATEAAEATSTEATSTEATSTETTATEATSTEATATEATATEATSTEATATEATTTEATASEATSTGAETVVEDGDTNTGASGQPATTSSETATSGSESSTEASTEAQDTNTGSEEQTEPTTGSAAEASEAAQPEPAAEEPTQPLDEPEPEPEQPQGGPEVRKKADFAPFSVPAGLSSEGGGSAPSPHPFSIANMGDLSFKEFESEADLFSYVQQDGYGWDSDKPAICMAFQVHENEDKNKYELELYFRDQWPKMYQTMERLDSDLAPTNSATNILAYTRQAYNGLNLMQVFAANSILQRRVSPEAEIIMMTVPFKAQEFVTDSYKVLTEAFTSFFLFVAILPLVFYTAFALAKEKEAGFQRRLFKNGLNPLSHFASWLLLYTVLALVLALVYTGANKKWLYPEDDFGLILLVTFIGIESLFSFVWMLRNFTQTSKMAMIVTGFFVFISFHLSYASDQLEGPLDFDLKRFLALSPLTAIKNTVDTCARFHTRDWPITFENMDTDDSYNWSISAGLTQSAANFVIYLVIAFLIEFTVGTIRSCERGCLVRSVVFENNKKADMCRIEVMGLQERSIGSKTPVYNLTIEKSQICCLIGTDSADKTNLMEMIAGQRNSKGRLMIKDSDFFARGKRPKLSEFLVHRSQDIILDNELSGIDHLNIFAHLRGNQKLQSTYILCDRLLPGLERVGDYSESQRQCLQTLIALCSENSRIILLDEPTRGLGPVQRSEMIKALWRFKKDRYIIIQSADAELVNVLADSVAKVQDTGIETVTSREIDHSTASYKLIVEVYDGEPSDSLVRYLSKDVPDLTLEYHTELLTYYILPNISKQVLGQKATFLENNQDLLGLVDFEIVSLPAFEVVQRNIPVPVIPNEIGDGFEDSFDDIDYEVKKSPKKTDKIDEKDEQATSRKSPKKKSPRFGGFDSFNDEKDQQKHKGQNMFSVMQDKAMRETGMPQIQGQRPTTGLGFDIMSSEDDRPVTPVIAAPTRISEDPEMKEFLEMCSGPARRPAYRRDFYYDFKRYKTKRQFSLLQCPTICRRLMKEHWHNKSRCLAIFFLPAIYVFLSWHCVRYYRHITTGSLSLSPDLLPHRQPLLVNEKTQVGAKDTKQWIERLPMASEAFKPTYVDTSSDKNFYGFENALFDFSEDVAAERPWAQGAYQFYEMDEDRHKYKILSYSNTTAPFSTSLFPQFILESVMKTALNDDSFEFKVKVSSLPTPKEVLDKGSFMTFEDHAQTIEMSSMSEVVKQYSRISWETVGCVAAAWFILNALTLVHLVRERTSERKLFLESHGQSQVAYWLARYLHDIIFYMPVSVVAVYLISTYEPQMDAAARSVIFQPFAMLPFLYVCAYIFRNELSAVLTLLVYQLFAQWILPYVTVFIRLSASMENLGDNLFQYSKVLPMQSSISSMIFNSEVLKAMASYRESNEYGEGDAIETDEHAAINAQADIIWMLIQFVFFWFILLVVIEWRLPCCCCYEMKRITEDDNLQFFEQEDDFESNGESSEVANFLGEGQELQLRFHIKQKPRKQLAYLLSNFSLQKPSACFGLFCCCHQECLISDLSAQVQAGSKYAIVADAAHGKSTILYSLTNRMSAYQASGMIKKQMGRRTPVYTTQSYEVLLNELTLAENLAYFTTLGSIHPRLANQMIAAFGLYKRAKIFVKNLKASEKHLFMLILALSGSAKTVILDEPFTGLTHDQTIKLVKIIRQKSDCTLIVTSKSKATLELLQPQSILTIRDQNQPVDDLMDPSYLLAVRLKPKKNQRKDWETLGNVDPDRVMDMPNSGRNTDLSQQEVMNSLIGDELHQFIAQNFAVFEKLRGKKRNLVSQVISKLMIRARITPEVSQEIAEMVHEDLELQPTSQEIAQKCELIMSLYILIESLSKRFGEVHLEYRQDDYAVLRVVFNEDYRLKTIADDESFSGNNNAYSEDEIVPAFSSVVQFCNESLVMRDCTTSCHFLSARNAIRPTSKGGSSYELKTFIYNEAARGIERLRSRNDLLSQSQF